MPLEEGVLERVAQRTDGIGEDVIEHVPRQVTRPVHSTSMDDLTGDLDYPMVIVTAAANGERSGCLVGFHTQCSIEPMRWAVWISKANHTHHVARDAAVLAVHFPSVDDEDMAELFGGETEDEIDKFDRCDWTEGSGGIPLLDGSGTGSSAASSKRSTTAAITSALSSQSTTCSTKAPYGNSGSKMCEISSPVTRPEPPNRIPVHSNTEMCGYALELLRVRVT